VTYSVTVKSKDEAYKWLMEWFAAQPYMTHAHCMTLKTVRKGENGEDEDNDTPDSRPKSIILFTSTFLFFPIFHLYSFYMLSISISLFPLELLIVL
jgi:hypothetical protein